MRIKRIDGTFTVCKIKDYSLVDLSSEFTFTMKTDEENSLVCKVENIPSNVTERDDSWKAFRIDQVLDFSLIGILADIATILKNNKISIYAISTYNTDYILVKENRYEEALKALSNASYEII